MSEVVEATVVDEPGTEVAVAGPSNLFRSEDPAEVLSRAQATADALMPVVREKGLISNIQGREHLRVEAWTSLGAMLGVTPVCVWTRKLEDGWEARVEARTLDGRVVGAAESECLRAESTWKDRDDFAIRSMAQTRATSKALASVLRFVATLAGVEGTPAEEMPSGSQGATPISAKQADFLESLLKKADVPAEELPTIRAWAMATLTGGRGGSASKAIDALKGERAAEAVERARAAAKEWAAGQSDVPADTADLDEPDPVVGDADEGIPF